MAAVAKLVQVLPQNLKFPRVASRWPAPSSATAALLCGDAVIERFGNAIVANEGVPKVARRFEHLFGGYFFAVVYKVDHPAVLVRDNDLNRGIGVVSNAPVF